MAKKKKNKTILALFDYENVPMPYRDQYPFQKGRVYMLTPVPGMPGHVSVMVPDTGKVLGNYHEENFVKVA